MKTHKITLKLVRAFSIGFTIFSPTLNGICISFDLACFSIIFWSRGNGFFAMKSYWG